MNATERETQTWWRANKMSSAGEIEAIAVVGETEKFVDYTHANVRKPLREAKETSWGKWFDNEADAVAFQRKRLTETVARMRAAVRNVESALAAFNEAHPLPATEE